MRRSVLLPIAVAISTFALILFVSTAGSRGTPSRESLKGRAVLARTLIRLPVAAHALALDGRRNRLWFVVTQFAGANLLYQFETKTGHFHTYPLPGVESDGSTTSLAVAPSGAVYIGESYTLSRWDSVTKRIDSRILAEAVPGRSPRSEDHAAPLAGTWISAMSSQGERAIISRLNVPYLQVVTQGLDVTQGLSIPANYQGSRSMAIDDAGVLYVAPGYLNGSAASDVLAIGPRGITAHTGTVSARKVRLDSGKVTILAAGAASQSQGAGRLLTLARFDNARSDVSVNGQVMGIYDATAHEIRQVSPHGSSVLRLQSHKGMTSHGEMTVWEEVTDLVTDASGHTWFLRGNGTELAMLG
jgi:hypothetical protein